MQVDHPRARIIKYDKIGSTSAEEVAYVIHLRVEFECRQLIKQVQCYFT